MLNKKEISSECEFVFSKSSGKGGQHVNKTSTQVSLRWNISDSKAFGEAEIDLLLKILKPRLSQDSTIIIQASDSRSQFRNKKIALERLFEMVTEGLRVEAKRISTSIPRAVKRKRLQTKKHRSELKKTRRKI